METRSKCVTASRSERLVSDVDYRHRFRPCLDAWYHYHPCRLSTRDVLLPRARPNDAPTLGAVRIRRDCKSNVVVVDNDATW
jgi:hypothetical protein